MARGMPGRLGWFVGGVPAGARSNADGYSNFGRGRQQRDGILEWHCFADWDELDRAVYAERGIAEPQR